MEYANVELHLEASRVGVFLRLRAGTGAWGPVLGNWSVTHAVFSPLSTALGQASVHGLLP